MAKKDVVLVKILDLPGVSGGCSCGGLPCSPEMAAMFQQKVDELRVAQDEAYPGRTGVSHLNLKESQEERENEIGQLLRTWRHLILMKPLAAELH